MSARTLGKHIFCSFSSSFEFIPPATRRLRLCFRSISFVSSVHQDTSLHLIGFDSGRLSVTMADAVVDGGKFSVVACDDSANLLVFDYTTGRAAAGGE